MLKSNIIKPKLKKKPTHQWQNSHLSEKNIIISFAIVFMQKKKGWNSVVSFLFVVPNLLLITFLLIKLH